MKGQIVGVLLAAGFSTRFGANKLLHCLDDGTPLAIAAARNLIQGIPRAVAVIGPGNDPLGELIERVGLDVVVNDRAGEGMGASLAHGVKATSEGMGWVIALADCPSFTPRRFGVLSSGCRVAQLSQPRPMANGTGTRLVSLGRCIVNCPD